MARLKFSDIVSRVESIANVTNQRNVIKDAIQMGMDRATAHDLPYLMTDGLITTVAPYTTGTLTATNNSKTITGADTVWTAGMVGRKIRINSEDAYYRIAAYVSPTQLTLETVYQGTGASSLTYSIFKDEYRLPADVDTYKVMRQIENGIALYGMNASAFDIVEATPRSEGDPNFVIFAGTKLDTYTTGTLTGSVNSSTLTGVDTVWASVEGLGRGSRITIGTNVYVIKSVDSDTQITLYDKLVSAVSGSAYTAHLDNYIIQLYQIPDSIQNIYFRYQRIPYPLVNDEDIPDLPERWQFLLVYAGLIWAWKTKDKEESKSTELLFESGIQQFWRHAGYPDSTKTFSRKSQDILPERSSLYRYPSQYGLPIRVR